MPIELSGTSFDHLTQVSVFEHARLVQHAVPGMNGDLTQVTGRSAVCVRFQGIFYGADAAGQLKGLRDLSLAQQPVDFYTESVGSGYFAQVLISRLEVHQRAGYPDQFDYLCEVVEWVEPPKPQTTSALSGINTSLLDEAIGSVDSMQNALKEASGLVDMLTNLPNFGNPTTQLPKMLDGYTALAGNGEGPLQSVRAALA